MRTTARERSLDILKSWARVLTDEGMTQTQAHTIAEQCREFAAVEFQFEQARLGGGR